MRTPAVQTVAAQKILKTIAQKTGTTISISKLRFRFNRNLLIRDLFIADLNNDTLLYAHKINLDIDYLDIGTKVVTLSSASINNLVSTIYKSDSNKFNFSFIIDSLKKDSAQQFNWDIKCHTFNINGANVSLNKAKENGFELKNLYTKTKNIAISKHETSFNVDQTSCNIGNDLEFKKLAFNFHLQDNLISLRGFNLLTNKSHLNIVKTKLIIPKKESKKNLYYSFNIQSSKLIPHEFGIFIPKLKNNFNSIQLTGKVIGDDTNLAGEKIKLLIGDATTLNTDFVIANINDVKKIKYDITIHELFSNKNSVDKLIAPFQDSSVIVLPEQLTLFGNIFYTGKLKGTLNNLESYGSINCDIGIFETKLTLDKEKNNTLINGYLKTQPLYIGSFIEDTTIGSIDIDLYANGYYIENESLDLIIDGYISNITYQNISLDSININGNVKGKSFYGRISSYDPKLRFDFEGLVNMDSIREYKFKTSVYSCNVNSLGFDKFKKTSDLSFNLKADFKGNDIINSTGSFIISDLFFFNDSSYFATDTIEIKTITAENSPKEIVLNSEFINSTIIGDFHPTIYLQSLKNIGNSILPSMFQNQYEQDSINNFSFSISADYPHPFTEFLFPELRISPGTSINGNFNPTADLANINIVSDNISYKNKDLKNLKLFCRNSNNNLDFQLISSEFKYNDENSLKNFTFSSHIKNDSIKNNINWNNWLLNNYSGNVNSLVTLSANAVGKKPNIKIDVFPSNLVMNDTIWELKHSTISSDTSGILFSNLNIGNGNSVFSVNGKLSDNPNDSIDVFVKNINLSHLNTLLKAKRIEFGGTISGNSRIKDFKGEQKINFDLFINDFTINNSPVGKTRLKSNWNNEQKQLNVLGITTENKDTTFKFNGYISPSRNEINCNVIFNNYNLVLLEAFMKPTFSDVTGRGSGEIILSGTFPSPHWDGYLYCENTKLRVDPLKVSYSMSDTIFVKENSILLNNILVYDKDSNYADVNGSVHHVAYKNFSYNVDIESKKIIGIDTKYSDNPLYHGIGIGEGSVRIHGPANDLNIDIAATTLENTKFTIPLEGKGEITDNDFINFYDPYSNSKTEEKEESKIIEIEENRTNLNISLTVTPSAEVLIIFDPQVGDMLKASGNAELIMETRGSDFFMYGDFNIYKGDFIFTLQNVINKRLEIQAGSNVSWSGNPRDADIDLDAVYKIRRVNLGDLTQVEEDKTKKIPVNCHLLMTNKLQNPDIKFMVEVPATTNNEAVEQINSLTDDEINKQVLSLLLVNKFTPLPGLIQTDNANTTSNLGATTASELLSNQLSSWMSQVTTEFDVGFSYRPGDDNTQQEVEFALSTTFWDDRIAVNGNFGYTQNQNTSENTNTPYTTDFQVELKLNKKGNIRLNAFQKVNNDYIYNGSSPYTQGLGIFYTEEFNDFDELIMKMFRKDAAQKPDEPEIEVEMENPEL